MKKIEFINDSAPYLSAENLNLLQDNIEESVNEAKKVVVSAEEPTTGEEVWLEKGKNLIDENLLIFGMELDGKGGTIARSNYYITPFIEIESNTIYTFKGAKSLKGTDNYYTDYYDKDYNFISSNEFSTFTTPSNAKYVRFNGCSDFSIDLQLEKGEKIAPKKIHTKTDNGYEEFYNEENREIYSTEEQRIGTFLGKPLYRIAGTYKTLISNGTLTVLVGVGSNVIDRVVNFNVMCRVASTYYNKNQDTSVFVSTGNFCIKPTQDIGEVDYIAEYTKTTD